MYKYIVSVAIIVALVFYVLSRIFQPEEVPQAKVKNSEKVTQTLGEKAAGEAADWKARGLSETAGNVYTFSFPPGWKNVSQVKNEKFDADIVVYSQDPQKNGDAISKITVETGDAASAIFNKSLAGYRTRIRNLPLEETGLRETPIAIPEAKEVIQMQYQYNGSAHYDVIVYGKEKNFLIKGEIPYTATRADSSVLNLGETVRSFRLR